MTDLEWKDAEPEDNATEKRIDLVAFGGETTLASLLYQGPEIQWIVIIDKREEFLSAENEEDAKAELLEMISLHYEEEIEFNKNMLLNVKEFMKKR